MLPGMILWNLGWQTPQCRPPRWQRPLASSPHGYAAPERPERPSASPRMMAKGDGKQRRKKQSPEPDGSRGSAAGSGGGGAADASARVSADRLLSVRKQIAIVKAYRAQQSGGGGSGFVRRTSFRRKKEGVGGDDDELDGSVDSAKSRGADAWKMPLLLVDGYNIIGKWPRLKKRKDRDDMDGARQMLLDDLLVFSARRFEVVCVFDAYGRQELRDREESHHGMRVVFTANTADEYIEQETLRLQQEKTPQRVWAATGDRAIQVSASMHGATVVSASWLVRELKDSRAEAAGVVEEFNKQQLRRHGRSSLVDSLQPGALEEIESLFTTPPTAALSRKDREAAEMVRLQEEANARLKKPAIPPRRRSQTPPKPRPDG